MSNRHIYVNLAVADLPATIQFFTALGFEFNPQFTDDNATAMVINETCAVMLMTKQRFGDFTTKPLADNAATVGVIVAVSADSREAVDTIVDTALSSGGTPATDAQDHGFMYVRSFYDLDGHHWEIAYMDMSQMPAPE